MQALAAEEMAPGVDENGATQELVTTIERLAMEPTLRRHDELIAKRDLARKDSKDLFAARPRKLRKRLAKAISPPPAASDAASIC